MRVNLNIIENKILAVHCIMCLCLEDKILNKPHYYMTKMQISVTWIKKKYKVLDQLANYYDF